MGRRKKIAPYQIFWAIMALSFVVMMYVIYSDIRAVVEEDARGEGTVSTKVRAPIMGRSFSPGVKDMVDETGANATIIKEGRFLEQKPGPSLISRQSPLSVPQEDSYANKGEKKEKSYYPD